jgi:hypothetical protein
MESEESDWDDLRASVRDSFDKGNKRNHQRANVRTGRRRALQREPKRVSVD